MPKESILLLNNDTEIINDDCLEELLGYCTREDVGAVGARLYYEDDTIQHAGVVIGFGGIAGHCFVQQAWIYRVLPPDHLCTGLQCGDCGLYDGKTGSV